MTGRPPARTPEAREAKLAELRDIERQLGDEMQRSLQRTNKLPEADRPLVVRNLGRMLESRWGKDASRHTTNLFEAAYPTSAASYAKKRARYIRFEGEALPRGRPKYGEYASSCAAFLRLAEAYASSGNGVRNEDSVRRAVFCLLEGTSLDPRTSTLRDEFDACEALRAFADDMLAEVLREVDLRDLFGAFVNYPLERFCELSETLKQSLDELDLELLEDLVVLPHTSPDDERKRNSIFQQDYDCIIPLRYRFQSSVPVHSLGLRADTWRLDPAALVPGAEVEVMHWAVPRLQIGWAYFPGLALAAELNVDPDDIALQDSETAEKVVDTALREAMGGAYLDLDSDPSARAALWSEQCMRQVGPIGEHVFWIRYPIFLGAVPLRVPNNPEICLWTELGCFEQIAQIGTSFQNDRMIFGNGDLRYFEKGTKLIVFKQLDDVICPEDHEYPETLLTLRDQRGQDFVFGKGIHLLRSEVPTVDVQDIRDRHCRAFIRLSVDDPYETWTPVPHDTLAAALVRNHHHSQPELRLGRRLSATARPIAQLLAEFQKVQRSRFQRLSFR